MNIKSPEDWYKISYADLKKHNAGGALDDYFKSAYDAAKIMYPNYKFNPFCFLKAKGGANKNPKLIKPIIEKLKVQLGIKKNEDWAYVLREQTEETELKSHIGSFGLKKILKICYPKTDWDSIWRRKNHSIKEVKLFNLVSALYPNKDVIHNKSVENCRYKKSNRKITADVYIPKLKIAFEYQGMHKDPKVIERDKEKAICFKYNKIKLIVLPEEWDGKFQSLKKLMLQKKIKVPNVNVQEKLVSELKIPDSFQNACDLLLKYRKENNGSDPPMTYRMSEGFNLPSWMNQQRQFYKKGLLTKERFCLLKSIDFIFEPKLKSRRNKSKAK